MSKKAFLDAGHGPHALRLRILLRHDRGGFHLTNRQPDLAAPQDHPRGHKGPFRSLLGP